VTSLKKRGFYFWKYCSK